MNRKQLYKTFDDLQKLISYNGIPLIYEAFELFSPIIEGLKRDPENLLVENGNGQQKRSAFTNKINAVIGKEKELKYRKIIVESAFLEDELKKSKGVVGKNNEPYIQFISEIEDKLEDFLSCYEKHMRAYSITTCLSLSISASELKVAINTATQGLKVISNFPSVKEDELNLVKLELYLSNVTSLKDFATKLNALSEIYKELLSLSGLTESDQPIVIEHIESGSLWIKIAGHTLTATLLTSILTTSTTYYQDNFTISGELKKLPVSVKAVEDLLKISKQLEKEGVNVKDINKNIESATRKITRNLDVLLGDQPSVEINDTTHNIGEALTQKLLEESKTYKIEYQEDLGSNEA